jgi:hypothetical protein
MTAKQYRDETGRVCTKCNRYKSWDNFNKGVTEGYRPDCRDCQKDREKSYERDKEKGRATQRRYAERKRRLRNDQITEEKDQPAT